MSGVAECAPPNGNTRTPHARNAAQVAEAALGCLSCSNNNTSGALRGYARTAWHVSPAAVETLPEASTASSFCPCGAPERSAGRTTDRRRSDLLPARPALNPRATRVVLRWGGCAMCQLPGACTPVQASHPELSAAQRSSAATERATGELATYQPYKTAYNRACHGQVTGWESGQ